jgi:integrase
MKRHRANFQGSVRKKGRRWYVRLTTSPNKEKGIRRRRAEIPTKARTRSEALVILGDRLTETRRGQWDPAAERTRVVDLYKDLRRHYRLKGKREGDLAWRWKHLEPVFGGVVAKNVTSVEIERYAEERSREGASGGTVNRELSVLRRMFRLGAAGTPPRIFRIPTFTMLAENDPRMTFFEHEEFEKLRTELPTHLRVLATLAYWLGWRRGELLRLEWRRVDLKRGTIQLNPGTTKNKKGRHAFLPPDALTVLKAWREETSRIERERGIIVRHVLHQDSARHES